jgi:hypothetical protein
MYTQIQLHIQTTLKYVNIPLYKKHINNIDYEIFQ